METTPSIPNTPTTSTPPPNRQKLALIIFLLVLVVGAASYFFSSGNFQGMIKLNEGSDLSNCMNGLPTDGFDKQKIYPLDIKKDCETKQFVVATDDPAKAEILFTKIVATQDAKDQSTFTFTADTNLKEPILNWDFGDGSASVDLKPKPHVYAEAGEKIVTLTAVTKVDDKDVTLKATKKINIVSKFNVLVSLKFDEIATIDGKKVIANKGTKGGYFALGNGKDEGVFPKLITPQGLSFDGVDDYLDLKGLDSDSGTVSFWIKPEGTGKDIRLMALKEGASSTAGTLSMGIGNEGWLSVWNGSDWKQLSDKNLIKSGELTNIIVVFEGNKGKVQAYINGKQQTYTTNSNLELKDKAMSFGAMYANTYGKYFKGSLYDFKFIKDALTSEEIEKFYKTNPAPVQTAVTTATTVTQPAPEQAVLYYDFNDATISNGKVFGTPKVIPGISGNALLFNGITDKIEIPSFPEIETTKTSLSLWVKQVGATGRIIAERHDGGASGFSMRTFGQHQPADSFGFIYRSDVNKWELADSNIVPKNNQWYHLVGTFDDKIEKIYVNGELKSTITANPVKVYKGGKFYIGYGATDHWQYFNGAIDELKIYNKELSDAEVSKLFNDGKAIADKLNDETSAVKDPKPITYIPFVGNTADGFKFNGTTALNPLGTYFNGSSDSVVSNSAIDLTNYNKLTSSFWLKINDFKDKAQLIAEFSQDYNYSTGSFAISQAQNEGTMLDGGKLAVSMHDSSYVAWVTDFVPQNGEWYHVTATMDRTASVAESVKLYINGKVNGSNALAWAKSFPGNFGKHNLYLGARGGKNYFSNINMAEFKLYGTLMTPEQIDTQYQKDLGLLDKLKASTDQVNTLNQAIKDKEAAEAALPPKAIIDIPFKGGAIPDGFTAHGTKALNPLGASFNGAGDYVDSNSEIGFNQYNKITVAYWFRQDGAIKDWANIVETSPNYNYYNGSFIMGLHTPKDANLVGKMNLAMKDTNGIVLYRSNLVPEIGKWYYVVATIDRTAPVNDVLKLYINGEKNGDNWPDGTNGHKPKTKFIGNFTNYKLTLGARAVTDETKTTGYFTNMSMAEFKILNKALTADEVKSQYAGTSAPVEIVTPEPPKAPAVAPATPAPDPIPAPAPADPVAPAAPADPAAPDPAAAPQASINVLYASLFNTDISSPKPLSNPITFQYGDALVIVTHNIEKTQTGILHFELDGKRQDFDIKVPVVETTAASGSTAATTSGGGGGGGGGGGVVILSPNNVPVAGGASMTNTSKPNVVPRSKSKKNGPITIADILKKKSCLQEFTPPIFSDTENATTKILASIGSGGEALIKGMEKDEELIFNGDADVERAQWVKVTELIGCIPWNETDISDVDSFSDISEDDWERTFVLAGRKLEIVNGYEDNTFRSGQPITHMESLKVLAKIAGIPAAPKSCKKQEVVDVVEHWGSELFHDAYCNNIVVPEIIDGEAYFRPDDNLTRNEMIKLLYNYLVFEIQQK